jgi:ABC-type lipoprotein release transport system permease subunit
MIFVRLWVRLELTRRWRSLAVLALLVALASAAVMASVAGARRSASAIERMHDRTKPATVAVYSNTPDFPWEQVRHLPDVEAMHLFLLDYTYSFKGLPHEVLGFPPVDDAVLHDIETPVVFEGRMWNPDRADEVVITRNLARTQHKKVGDKVTLQLPTIQEMQEQEPSGPDGSFTGPHIETTIVGVIGSPWFSDDPGGPGYVFVSPAVVAQYRENTVGPGSNPKNLFNFVSAIVRLRHGEADLPRFQAAVSRIQPDLDLEFTNTADLYRQAQRQIIFQSRCLLAFGGAAFLAALFLIGQAVARYTAASVVELRALRAMGVTSGQGIAASATGPAIAGVLGALAGAGGAFVASGMFPLGTAEIVEPSPGRSADWTVFGPGIAAVVLLVAVGAACAAKFALAAADRDQRTRRSALATAAARSGLPVPLVVGTRFAFEAGRGPTAVPIRPALIGAVGGVLGVLAAFTFSQGVSDAVSHPERFGQTAQLDTYLGTNDEDFVPADQIVAAVTDHPDVTGVNDARQSVASDPEHTGTIVLYSHAAQKPLPVALMRGRMPVTPDEVALAPVSLKLLKASVGDTVTLVGNKSTRRQLVTGSVLLPGGPRNSYSEGGFLTTEGYDALFTGFKFHMLQLSLRPGADVDATNAALSKAVTKAVPEAAGFSFEPAEVPFEVAELKDVRRLPLFLGVFLAVLAVGAVGHALATAVRRRSRDVAVLRALGMTQRQSRVLIVTQATALVAVGLLFGVPLGLAVGRTVWRVVADDLPTQYVTPWAAWAMLLVAPVALLLANVLAAVPGRRAARMHVAQILRAE